MIEVTDEIATNLLRAVFQQLRAHDGFPATLQVLNDRNVVLSSMAVPAWAEGELAMRAYVRWVKSCSGAALLRIHPASDGTLMRWIKSIQAYTTPDGTLMRSASGWRMKSRAGV